jgi:competence protein ComEA
MNRRLWDLLIGVLFGLISAALILIVSRPRPGMAILLRPPPTPEPVVVNIDGAVVNPGVYSLAVNSRVQDAIIAAGGFTDHASLGAVNQAALLEDGTHIYIPAKIPEREEGSNSIGSAIGISETGEEIRLININQATLEELISLPGIGPVTAEKIISYREEGLFTRIEDIQKVPGIGPATYEQIRIYLTVGE